MLESLLDQPWMLRAGWTLVHFLWQGSVIAAVLAAAGAWLGARARYALSCVALALMSAAPPLTFVVLGSVNPSSLVRPIWPVGTAGAWERILPWMVVVWLGGAALFSARVAVVWRKAARARNAAVQSPPREWLETLEELVRRMRVTAPVRLLSSPLATVPSVVGWLKPVILMPVEAMIGLPLDQVRSIMAHELAHIRRNDYLVNILQCIAEALLFYHPAVWWVSGQIRAERELCCDDLAVETSGDVLTYARALANLETFRRARLNVAMAADGASLLNRIRRLAGEAGSVPHHLPGPGSAWALALLWMAGAGAVALHASQPQPVPTLRPFTPPGIAAAPQIHLDAPPLMAPRTAPLLSALLFDPFLAPQQAPAPPAGSAGQENKQLAGVSGTVRNTAGKPVANATVRLMPSNPMGPVPMAPTGASLAPGTPQTIPQAQTDAEGKFSIELVPPGSYTIRFQHKDYFPATYGVRPGIQQNGTVLTLGEGRRMTGIDMVLPEPSAFVGRVVDEDGDPMARILVLAYAKHYYYPQLRGDIIASIYSGDNGEFRLAVPPGRYYIAGQKRPTWTSSERAPIAAVKPGQKLLAPVATFWGGADHIEDAVQVEIGPGQNTVLGDFKMLNMPIVHVRGKVTGDPALLKGARVVRVPDQGGPMPWSYGADIEPDGSFDMANMWPYEFTIGVFSPHGGYLGLTDIVVGDKDLEKVQIAAAATPFSGSVTVEDSPGGPPTQAMPKRIELTSTGYYKISSAAAIRADGGFTLPSLPLGTYFVDVKGLAQDSYVKSARFKSRDVLTEPLDWGGDNGQLEIAISPKAPVFDGSVVDADGKPAPGTVTLVPDPQRPGHSLLYPTAQTDDQGQFRFQSVAPGSYKVYAWEKIPEGAHVVPDFIEPFAGVAERIEMQEGGHQTLVLKRISVESLEDTLRRAGK
jgi:beta-lactamase regulating signal transducer with metallopeptidase domain/protocatechuate 3,4-dioxygenase beta subunit